MDGVAARLPAAAWASLVHDCGCADLSPEPSPEFAVLEDDPDDDAIRAKALNQNFRGLARQAALDPDDGLGL